MRRTCGEHWGYSEERLVPHLKADGHIPQGLKVFSIVVRHCTIGLPSGMTNQDGKITIRGLHFPTMRK